ncbi:DUF3052 domain-containing protein [Kocuria coralli]|uniref:DUF3052 domain-containing protein n=1 Tax=Kocuria coralli TaxID=1461025 RepID=A0A5J5KWI2_9MICC|nr:DUF3052 domain-containing protein [Kocuria coralli]KAA9393255.1 DUF3052 domain-containing protein [Kocuria coralli]
MSEAKAAADDSISELGLSKDSIVQEFGYDDDVDFGLRERIENITDDEILDEEDQEVVDAVLLWWRDGDGDLVDALVDTQSQLDEGGVVWLLTPKSGRNGYVTPTDIESASSTAGLHRTSTAGVSADWAAVRLAPKRNF